MTTFPDQLHQRAAAVIARTARLVGTAHQRLNTLGSQVSALTPGSWELLTLAAGWSNVPGFIPAQVRILQAGMSQLVGHIEGGTTTDGTVIGTLTAGFFNPSHAHSFTANVLAGAAAVSVSGTISGQTDSNNLSDSGVSGGTTSNALSNGSTQGNSASASGSGAHTHGAGSYQVTNSFHVHSASGMSVNNDSHTHTNLSGAQIPATPVNYNTVILTMDTAGNLTLANCPASAAQLSFSETLPLVTS